MSWKDLAVEIPANEAGDVQRYLEQAQRAADIIAQEQEAKAQRDRDYQQMNPLAKTGYNTVMGTAQAGIDTVSLMQRGAETVGELAGKAGLIDVPPGQELPPVGQRASDQMVRDSQQFQSELPQGTLGKGWRGAVRSISKALLARAVGAPVFPAILAEAAATAGNEALTDASDANLKGVGRLGYAGGQALIEGGITGTMQRMGMGGMESVLAGGAKGGVKEVAKGMFNEFREEAGIFGASSVLAKAAGVNPNATDAAALGRGLIDVGVQSAMGVGAASAPSMAVRAAPVAIDGARYATDPAYRQHIANVTQAKQTKNSPGREAQRAQAESIAEPDNVNALLQERRQTGSDEALRTLAGKDAPSRKDFEQAGLPSVSGDARKRFAENLRGIFDGETQAAPLAPQKPPRWRTKGSSKTPFPDPAANAETLDDVQSQPTPQDVSPLAETMDAPLPVQGAVAQDEAAQVVSPHTSPAQEYVGKQPWEATADELDEYISAVREMNKNLERELFGEEGAKRYWAAQQTVSSSSVSSYVSRERTDKANKLIEEMEAALTEQQRNRLNGIGEAQFDIDELKDYRLKIGDVSGDNAEELGRSLAFALPVLSVIKGQLDPQAMDHEQRLAYAQLLAAKRLAAEMGFDLDAVGKAGIRAAASRFSDQNDAVDMLERFFAKPTTQAPPRLTDAEMQRIKDEELAEANRRRAESLAAPAAEAEMLPPQQTPVADETPNRPLWEMDASELSDAADAARANEDKLLGRLFGPDRADRYRAALLNMHSTDDTRATKAREYLEESAAALNDGQRKELNDTFESDYSSEALRPFVGSKSFYAPSPYDLGVEIAADISNVSEQPNTPIEEMRLGNKLSASRILEAQKIAKKNGWNQGEVGRGIAEELAKQFPDAGDRQRILDGLPKSVRKAIPIAPPKGLPAPLPRVDTRQQLPPMEIVEPVQATEPPPELAQAGISVKNTPQGWSVTGIPEELADGLKTDYQGKRNGKGYFFRRDPTAALVDAAREIAAEAQRDAAERAAGRRKTSIGYLEQEQAEAFEQERAERLKLAKDEIKRRNDAVDHLISMFVKKGRRGAFKLQLINAAERGDASSVKNFDLMVEYAKDHPELGLPTDEHKLFALLAGESFTKDDAGLLDEIDAELAADLDDVSFDFGANAEPQGQKNIFGEVEPQKVKPDEFETTGDGQQGALFAKKGLPGQGNLFADKGVPDDMVAKVKQRQSGGLEIPVTLDPKAKPIAAQDIIATMARDFGVPIRSGRMGMPRKVAGIYKEQPEIVRTRGKFNADLAVVSHEVAHHLDKIDSPYEGASPTALDELKGLDYDPKQKRVFEGFAEFVRHYITTGQANALAPEFAIHFFRWLDANPDWKVKFERATRLTTQWREQGAQQRVRGQRWAPGRIAEALEGSTVSKVLGATGTLAKGFYSRWADKNLVIQQLDKEAVARGFERGDDVTAGELIAAYSMASSSHAERALTDGFHTVSKDHQIIGQGLAAAFKPLQPGEYDDWADYHLARHAVDTYEKMPGYNPGIMEEDAKFIVDKVRSSPQAERFEQVSSALTQFNNDRLKMLQDAGVLTGDDVAKMLAKWGDTYTSLRRVRSKDALNVVKRVTSALLNNKQSVRKRSAEGSGSPVMDPLDATIMNAIEAYDSALKQQVWLRLINETVPEYGGAEGMGKWVEKVPPNKKPTTAKMEQILDQLQEAGFDEDLIREVKIKAQLNRGELSAANLNWIADRYGIDINDEDSIDQIKAALSEVPDPETAITIWKPDFSPSKQERIVRVVVNGQPQLFKLHDDLYEAVDGMAPLQLHPFMEGLSWFTKMQKLGATGVNTIFAGANVFRDFATTQFTSKHQGIESLYAPFQWTGAFIHSELLRASPEYLKQYAAKVGLDKPNEAIKLWEEMGGRISTTLGMDSSRIQMMRGVLTGDRKLEGPWLKVNRGIQALRDVVGVFEAGPRLAEFAGYLRENGYKIQGGKIVDSSGEAKRPPRSVIVGAALAARDVTVDFTRSGKHARYVDKFIPFFNAAVQSKDKFGRTIIGMSRGDKGWQRTAIALAASASAAVAYWMLRHDDDDYKEQEDWVKTKYWTFTFDGAPGFQAPKPHEWGLLPSAIEAMLNAWVDKDPEAAGKFVENELHNANPVKWPTLIGPTVDVLRNKDSFTGRPIENESMLRLNPEYRSKPWTSSLSNFIGYYTGKYLGIGPAKVEHLINQGSGGAISRNVSTTGRVIEGDSTPSDIPLIGGFIPRREYNESIDQLYERSKQVSLDANSAEHAKKPSEELKAEAKRLAAYTELIGEFRKPVYNEQNQEKRFEYEKYMVGLSRRALGKEPLDRYPDPFVDGSAPKEIQVAVDEFLGNKVFAATQPDAKKETGESDADFAKRVVARKAEWADGKKWLADIGVTQQRAEKLLPQVLKRRGMKETSEAADKRKKKLATL